MMDRITQIKLWYLPASIIGFLVLALNGCAVTDISLLPMYGGAEKTEKQKQADAEYLQRMDENFKDRRKASDSAARVAWSYWRKGDWQTAMRRFNQTWLLDPDNYQAYWGYLVILGARGNYDESSKMADKALSLAPGNHWLLCDAAFTYGSKANLIAFNREEKDKYLHKAFTAYEKAAANKPGGQICRTWAMTLYQNGQYPEAWNKVKRSEDLGYRYPETFLNALTRKMPRPDSF